MLRLRCLTVQGEENVFRFFGATAIAISVALALIGIGVVRRLVDDNGVGFIQAIISTMIFPLYGFIVGIGLLKLKRWAAVGLALPAGLTAIWLIIGSLIYVPICWAWINGCIGLLMLLPTVAAILFGSVLKPAITDAGK